MLKIAVVACVSVAATAALADCAQFMRCEYIVSSGGWIGCPQRDALANFTAAILQKDTKGAFALAQKNHCRQFESDAFRIDDPAEHGSDYLVMEMRPIGSANSYFTLKTFFH